MRLYHLVPKGGIEGELLLPLRELQGKFPNAYGRACEKYQGRKYIPDVFVPILDCKWADVVQMSPVHPQVVHCNLKAFGHPGLVDREAFVIDTTCLDPARLVVFEFTAGGGEYSKYDPERHMRYSLISDATIEHYRSRVAEGQKPFIFQGITHVLYMGEIPISGLPVVRVCK